MERTIMKFKRLASLIITIAMLISMVPSVFASYDQQFGDFPTGWSRPAMEAAVDNGLLVGIGGGKIGPQKYLTRAEMAAVMVRAFGANTASDISAYTDVDVNSWYYSSVASAVKMGALSGTGDNRMAPSDYITREQVFSVLSRVLALQSTNYNAIAKFSDASEVSGWALSTVIPLVERGYVNGDNFGKLNPKANITREEFAQLMYTTIRRYITQPGTYQEDMEGIVVIRCGNVTLKNMTVNGDLVVGDGANKEFVNLDGVTVNGRLLTRGGSNQLKNTIVKYGVVVLNPNGTTPFRNYRSEAPFAGIIEYTDAAFLVPGSSQPGIGGGGVTVRHMVTFKIYEDDTDEYAELEVKNGKSLGSRMPDDPVVPGYAFNGWVDENGDPFTSETEVFDDMTVIADLSTEITVTFYEGYGDYAPTIGDEPLVLTVDENGEATVDAADIPDTSIYSWIGYKKSDYMPSSYDDFDGEHRVTPEFWYQNNGVWELFDETSILTGNTTVHLFYKNISLDAKLGTQPNVAVSTRYSTSSRLVDSMISMAHSAVTMLNSAKDSNNYYYNLITDEVLTILASKNIIDDDKFVKYLSIPLPINSALTETLIEEVVEERIEDIIATASLYDHMFMWSGVEEYMRSELSAYIPAGTSDSDAREIIKSHISGLTPTEKNNLAINICDVIYDTEEYEEIVDAIMDNEPLVVDDHNVKLLKEIHDELAVISFDTVMGLSQNSLFDKIVEIAEWDTCEEIFIDGRDRYCEDLEEIILGVEDGDIASGEIKSEFDLLFDPIEDVLSTLYVRGTNKAIATLTAMDIHYDENPYLQYLVEQDVIDKLFIDTGVATEEHTAYKLKGATDYADYSMELMIALNDALYWYGDEETGLSDEQIKDVYDAVFEKFYSVHDRIDGILVDYDATGDLPDRVATLLTSVQQLNSIYTRLEPNIKTVVSKYLESKLYDEIISGTLDENEKIQQLFDILIGKDDPRFTVDSLFEVFYQYDDIMQEKLVSILANENFDSALTRLRNSSVGEKLGDDAIDDMVEILENIAEHGVSFYLVDTSDSETIVERYQITIGDNIFTLTRSFMF